MYLCKKGGSPLSNQIQRFDEYLQLFLPELTEPLLDRIGRRCPDVLENLPTLRRDTSRHMAPIVGIPLASDQFGFLQPVEQPWDIRYLGDHAFADLTSAE